MTLILDCVHPQVMKCIVEALADVLSRPHPIPVSQECLATLKRGKQKKGDSWDTLAQANALLAWLSATGSYNYSQS